MPVFWQCVCFFFNLIFFFSDKKNTMLTGIKANYYQVKSEENFSVSSLYFSNDSQNIWSWEDWEKLLLQWYNQQHRRLQMSLQTGIKPRNSKITLTLKILTGGEIYIAKIRIRIILTGTRFKKPTVVTLPY